MKKVNVTINGKTILVPENYTIMEAAYKLGIDIPRLCFLKEISESSSCRICVVEIEGLNTLKNSCTVKVWDKMVVKTNTERVNNAVRKNLELIAASHLFECWRCPREHNCELLKLLRRYNVENKIGEDQSFAKKTTIANLTDAMVIDSSKCILCGRCVDACATLAGTKVLNFNYRGFKTYVSTALNHELDDSGCIYCGKCIQACPVGALKEKEDFERVFELLQDPDKYVVVQIAPAVRAALGEEFGLKIGTNVENKVYSSLKALGFDEITDTNFGADLTIMEEANEFIERYKQYKTNKKSVLPMFTSCSPGWIKYIEAYYPEYLPHLSSCKSPHQMLGAIVKNYYAEKLGLDPKKVYVVSVMPCIAKKYEANRKEMEVNKKRDVDYVITTRELARMIKIAGLDFHKLPKFKATSPLAEYTGAGAIFGATGGVMEAALRTVKDTLEKTENKDVDFPMVRGVNNGIKEASLKIAGEEFLVAVVHGAVNFPEMFKRLKENKKPYAFIEFMACTGGCVNGGGQPIVNAKIQDTTDIRTERAKALYTIDKKTSIRRSHGNPEILKIYEEFLGAPGAHKAHEVLHTTFKKQQVYGKIK